MLHICIYGNFSLNMFFPHISYALLQAHDYLVLYWNLNFHCCAFKILNYLIVSLFYVSDGMLVSGMISSILIILILKRLSVSGINTFFHFNCLLHYSGDHWHT